MRGIYDVDADKVGSHGHPVVGDRVIQTRQVAVINRPDKVNWTDISHDDVSVNKKCTKYATLMQIYIFKHTWSDQSSDHGLHSVHLIY